jgi:hypothetical protein
MSDVSDLERDVLRSAQVLDVPSDVGKQRARAILALGAAGGAVALVSKAKPSSFAWKASAWSSWKVGIMGVMGLAAVGSGVVYGTSRHPAVVAATPPAASPAPAPSAAVASVSDVPPVSSSDPAAAAATPSSSDEAPSGTSVSTATTRAAPSPRRVAPPSVESLADQSAFLGRVQDALDAHRAPAALATLDAFDRSFPNGAMSQEAAVLRVEALYQAGRTSEALALTDRLLAANPSSTHAEHLRTLRAAATSKGAR